MGSGIAPRNLIPSWKQSWAGVVRRWRWGWWWCAAHQLLSHQYLSWVKPNILRISLVLKLRMSQVVLLGSRLHIHLAIRHLHTTLNMAQTEPRLIPKPSVFLFHTIARHYLYRVFQGRNFRAVHDPSMFLKPLALVNQWHLPILPKKIYQVYTYMHPFYYSSHSTHQQSCLSHCNSL